MLVLWEQEPRGMQELGELLALDAGTLSPLLKRLEATGYISRVRRPGDERFIEIALTDAGRALRSRAEAIPASVVDRLGTPLEELQRLRGQLQHLTHRMDEKQALDNNASS